MTVAIGLYLYDSALFLSCNEGVLIPKGKKSWGVGFGSHTVQIKGKEPFLPNPFMFHRPRFRLSWRFEGSVRSESWSPPREAFWALVPLVWSMAVGLFVLLPLGFFTRLGEPILLLAILVLYFSIIIALVWLWFNRGVLHLSAKRFAALAFESLICPPFALNLIRHVSAEIPATEDLLCAARRLLDPPGWTVCRAEFLKRLESEIECEEEQTERMGLLHEHHRILSEEG